MVLIIKQSIHGYKFPISTFYPRYIIEILLLGFQELPPSRRGRLFILIIFLINRSVGLQALYLVLIDV